MKIMFFLFHALVFTQYFMVALSDSPSNVTDHLALLDVKNLITNFNSTVLASNWTTSTSFCNWVGVVCSPQRQRIMALNLSEMNLEGTISPSIANISSLTELDLSKNYFTGSIPTSIFNISSLRSLYLSNNSLSGSFFINGEDGFIPLEAIDISYNNLTGEIPQSLCRFTELKSLDLSYNNLTGQIPGNIGCLSRLERLYMTENEIVGTIPPSLGNISSLQFLGCVENNIGGRIPNELGKLSNLKMLGFDFNNLTGEIPPEIFNLSSLIYIAFTDNSLSGNLPANVGLHLPNLEGIYLADNLLEGEIPISITNASKLMELELSYNFFVGTVPNNLGNLRELRFLNLAGNRLTNDVGNQELGFISSLVECRMLQFLIVGNNPLSGILPDSVQNLSKNIEMFNIENSLIFGQIPRGIGNMSSMISLVLNLNKLTGNMPVEIGYLKELQRLYLNDNMLQGQIPVTLCDLVNLGDIILSENNLSGSIPNCIGNLGRVQRLMLGYNRLSSSLPLRLWEIRSLLFLNVSNNLIQGDLPTEVGMLQNAEGLDLSNNQLSSVIPGPLGELQNLRYLSLSDNSFEGSIPDSFGNLISLEFVDLSSNNLSGTIPVSLERLRNLREINVSYNHLEGRIPTGGVFSNSSSRSFEGNEDLCGLPSLGLPLCVTNRGSKGSSSKKHILRIVIPVIASVVLVTILLSFWIFHRRKGVKFEDPEVSDFWAYKTISYNEILQATNGFSESNLLGVGGSGSVFRGVLSDSTIVAVKVLNLDNEETQKRFDAECEVLKQIRHRNLVQVITTCSNDHFRAIVLPYMPNGSLESWLYKEGYNLDLGQRIEVMLDVAMAIEYLHHGYDFPVIHCDLKPANVLLDADMVAHVSDFGISKILVGNESSAQTKTLGTIGYIAPEYGSEGTVSTSGDVYSYGIMLMEVLTRRRPTDELFSDSLSLRQWVKAGYPNSLMEVVDANLFHEEDRLNNQLIVCLQSVVELSLDCSKEAPDERISMRDAMLRLKKIKERYMEK
ncbi:Serine/threonine protein kinase [Handroanthus impetiginosus]|uniref:non-specific serine/threonine protein kinase n=1 Tax=Handroanthus impetiginosus TaxID=429701 RepID=A0A2G9HSQ2_9LAMI|nr:Serine/threonine protein kinase [Handroanthus impetiginosus]